MSQLINFSKSIQLECCRYRYVMYPRIQGMDMHVLKSNLHWSIHYYKAKKKKFYNMRDGEG